MRELWAQAFKEFEKLADLTPEAADARMAEIAADNPRVAALIRKMRLEPAINLPPIPWHTIASAEGADAEGVTVTLLTGQRLGAYQLVREIGRGGMGSVWLGERADGLYRGQVAIKLLNGAVLNNVGARQRFAREGELLSKLAHPNIARLLDAGTTDVGARYLVLEYVDGVSLRAYCESHRLSVRATIELFCQALEAVAYAHSLLILHRDIKPGNVLVTRDGQVKLLDFGLGKLLSVETAGESDDMTRVGGPGYTPRYAPPEQMKGAAMGTASDVYSLGVTLYEILTGAQLDLSQRYTRPSELLAADSTRSGLSKEVRGDLDSIIAKAVSEQPQERYANAGAMLDDLHRYLNHEPVTAQPDTTLYRAGKFVHRHKLAVGSAALATLLTVVSLGVALWQWHVASVERTEARYQASAARTTLDVLDAVNEDVPPAGGSATTRMQIDRGLAIVKAIRDLDPTVRAAALESFASRYSDIGEIVAGMQVREEALATLAPRVPVDTRARNLYDELACQQAWDRSTSNMSQAWEELGALLKKVRAHGDAAVDTRLSCLIAASVLARSRTDVAAARAFTDEALQLLERAPAGGASQHYRFALLSVHSSALANEGTLGVATRMMQQLRDDMRDRGMENGTRWASTSEILAWAYLMAGDVKAADTWARTEVPRLTAIKGPQGLATRTYTVLARYWLLAGDYGQALHFLDEALAATRRNPSTVNEQRSIAARALILAYGDDREAAAVAMTKLRSMPMPASYARTQRMVIAMAEAAFALYQQKDAAAAMKVLQPFVEPVPALVLPQNGVWLLAAEAALAEGDATAALAHCRQARKNAEATAIATESSIWVGRALHCEADALYAQLRQQGTAASTAGSGDAVAAANEARARAERIFRAALPAGHPALTDPKRLVPRLT